MSSRIDCDFGGSRQISITMVIDASVYPAYAAECGDPSRTKILGFGSRAALVFVDVCAAYTSSKSHIALEPTVTTAVIEAASKLVEIARRTTRNDDGDTIPIFFAQTVYTHPELLDAGLIAAKIPYASVFSSKHPDNLTALPDAISAKPSDMKMSKKFPSAFFGTNLATQLAALGVDTLVIGGFLTSVSVRSTAIDAMQAGFRSLVVADACADRGSETHWANLMDHNAKYGDVVGLSEAVEAIGKGWTAKF
jgi:maleamate amidohydrolase